MHQGNVSRVLVVGLTLGFLTGCGSDGERAGSTASTGGSATTAAADATAPPVTTTAPVTTVPPATTVTTVTTVATVAPVPPATTVTTTIAQPVQVAIWPAADTVFASPESAAADFVSTAFGVEPALGAFEASDGRSGEISVMLGEGSAPPTRRSTLIMRQLAPTDGWFVVAAVNDSMAIDAPAALDAVPAGRLAVDGRGRGFEALIVVEAFVAGRADKLDQQTAMGGSADIPEPFQVTLDLSAALTGETVVVLIRGGVGLENDPGEFSALAVTIAD